MIICIVGKSGCGKTYISNLLESYSDNIVHLDIDTISHKVIEIPEVMHKLTNEFGESILSGNNINRKALAKIVFNSNSSMDKLTEITWNHMEQLIDDFISNNKNKIILLDWQLLPKTKYFENADLRILVNADFNSRMKQALIRDNITEEEFISREQAALEFKSEDFDFVINNDYSQNTDRLVKDIYDKSIISR